MATITVTTTYLYLADEEATDRTQGAAWVPAEDSASVSARIRWAPPAAK